MSDILRPLGATDIRITPIGLGTWQFSQNSIAAAGNWTVLDQDAVNAIVQEALDGGVNWFDTAEIYGFGRSERALARALLTAGVTPGQVVVATKWWPIPRFAGSIRKTIDKRIKNLSPYPIDLHQAHWPKSLSSIEAVMDAMADLAEAGKIRAVGVSNYNADQMRRAHDRLAKRGIPLASNQVKYNLLDRTIEENGVLAAAEELGVTIIAYSPLEMGLLTGKFHADPRLLDSRPWRRRKKLQKRLDVTQPLIDRMGELAQQYDATITQIGLNWLVNARGDRVVAIPGATKPRHAAEAAGVMRFTLTPDEMAELDDIARSLKGYQPISN
jgi:aryl-alcohol dehydrogenase-like predicted oxidoreductase